MEGERFGGFTGMVRPDGFPFVFSHVIRDGGGIGIGQFQLPGLAPVVFAHAIIAQYLFGVLCCFLKVATGLTLPIALVVGFYTSNIWFGGNDCFSVEGSEDQSAQ